MKKEEKRTTVAFWGTHEAKDTRELYRCLAGEVVATAILVWLATTNCAQFSDNTGVLKISLTVGTTIATVVTIFAPVSGSHVNPAITLGFLIVGRISALKALLYFPAQILGVIIGTLIYEVSTPDNVQGDNLCSNGINEAAGVTVEEALMVEVVLTFILMYLILTISDKNVHPHPGSLGITVCGLYATSAFLMGLRYSGVALNPARSIGLAILEHIVWDSIWVYWVGPMLGAALAGIIYRNWFDVAFQQDLATP
ncbi:aquaporin AQPcic-like [Homalodisca vitripennis]|uniref:aquaporin AQPcic-like n=1 Tax=Homalodisca vitripennis TaxID=197043 RepID=UPI001EEB43D0|nr:aquaporin AQPcic-like [Homalodisca vitripennis]